MKKNILITGGLGYVGGRIAKSLSNLKSVELILGVHKNNISKPDWLFNGDVVKIDLKDSSSLDIACKHIDTIIHCAALNEIDSLKNPDEALLINSLGTLKLLEAAEKQKVKRFIYFSTAHIYKSPLVGHISENTVPRPIHPYAITHKCAEDFVISFNDQKKLIGTVLRLSNSFGAPIDDKVNRWSLIINDLCRQAVTQKKLVLKTSGLQKRDFITLEDVCSAVKHFLDISPALNDNGIFNLGGELTLSILEVTELIASRSKIVLGYKPEIIRDTSNKNEKINELNYNIDKIKNTGFKLEKNINKELDDILMFCSKVFGDKNAE
jgi:UDP-glucose 4-epimerase